MNRFWTALTENAGGGSSASHDARADTGLAPEPVLSDPELLDAMARDSAQIAADFIWAGNRAAAREHLQHALHRLNEADAATTIDT